MNIVTRDTLPLLSFIVGLGVAVMLFHKPFQFRKMLSLPVDEMDGKIIRSGEKCYRYRAEDVECEIPSSK